MKTTEVNKELIGRRCECIFTGLMVTGVIEDTEENEHTKEVKVRFDRPHQWGDDLYNDVWAWGCKTDEFGTLRHLQLLEGKPDFVNNKQINRLYIEIGRFKNKISLFQYYFYKRILSKYLYRRERSRK